MSLFLTKTERETLNELPAHSQTFALLEALVGRVNDRATSPGLSDGSCTSLWWHHAAEFLTDAAFVHAIRPSERVASWLRSNGLSIARRPAADWAGPPFRGYNGGDAVGSLETAHLTWGLSIVIDLAPDVFTACEYDEIASVIRSNGLVPCGRFLDTTTFCHNWNLVLLAGYAVAAAVLDDADALSKATAWFPLSADHFQPDGSYGESLGYANYAAYSLVLAREAITRHTSTVNLTLEPYARMVQWEAQALLYRKPLAGWGAESRSRSANFGDSPALFRPSGDVLAHIATHARESMPVEAGLARWLLDTLYFPANEPPPHDLASFGFLPGFGFLTVVNLPKAAEPLSPAAAASPTLQAFSCGDVYARDAWNGRTILAMRTPSEPRHATAHSHGDINSFILAHRNERLLLDPGHSCYRNIIHELEASTATHSTCTFETPATAIPPSVKLTQRGGINRPIIRDGASVRGGAAIDLGGRRLFAGQIGALSAVVSEGAPLYGPPIRSFTRTWLLCGENALFIIDKIEADVPITTTWNWLFNNRDGQLDIDYQSQPRLIARRGDAGLLMSTSCAAVRSGPIYGYVHDCYHPLPGQLGEGAPGSGILMRWTELEPARSRMVVHSLCFDSRAAISAWKVVSDSGKHSILGPGSKECWTVSFDNDKNSVECSEHLSGCFYSLAKSLEGEISLTRTGNR
ncbi:MAG TPA: heparinase II/III family protein [Capsulimonadaceae bacterium]|jgi:hypothetical protein